VKIYEDHRLDRHYPAAEWFCAIATTKVTTTVEAAGVDLGVLSSFTNDRTALRQAIREIRNNSSNGRTPIIRITSINGDLSLGDLAKQNLRVLGKPADSYQP
jgi:hypothetical protein